MPGTFGFEMLAEGAALFRPDLAVLRGFVDVAAEFEPARSAGTPSLARFLREPAAGDDNGPKRPR